MDRPANIESEVAKRLDLNVTRSAALRDLWKWAEPHEGIVARARGIAEGARVSERTVYRWGEKWPEVREILES